MSDFIGGTRMFRNMNDEQRSKIDRSLEHHRVLECDPITSEDGTNYIIVVLDIHSEEDNIKKEFALMDEEGIPIKLPFVPSPYSGANQITQWIEDGKPDDPDWLGNRIEREVQRMKEEREKRYG